MASLATGGELAVIGPGQLGGNGRFIPDHPICPASLTWSMAQRT
jgi:hypothetical protein